MATFEVLTNNQLNIIQSIVVVMIFVSYDDDVKQNENYHPALERLWNPKSRQQRLRIFAENNRLFTLTQDQEKFQNWQKRAIARVLGLEQKESWKMADEQ